MADRSVRGGAIVAAAVLAVASGCTPSAEQTPTPTVPPTTPTASSSATLSPRPTSTPTPTPTWDPLQAAAIKAVDDFTATTTKIAADPRSFTRDEMESLFAESIGGDMIEANVASFMEMRERGYRVVGSVEILEKLATEPVDDGRGDEVHVTTCRDQRALSVVDENGAKVTEDRYKYPDYLLRQYSVRKPPGEDAFLVFGMQTIHGTCP